MGALRQGLGQLWSVVATFIPKFLVFLIILLIGWIVAKAIAKAIRLLFSKIGFSKLMDKTGFGEHAANFDIGEILVKLVYFFVLLIFVQLALGVFGPNPVSQFINDVVGYLPRIVVAIVLVIVAAAIGRSVGEIVRGSLGERPVGTLLGKITFGFITALGVIAALNQMGIGLTVTTPVLITFLATVGGVIVVGVGGGLIGPMQQRWSSWLQSLESEFSSTSGKPGETGGGGPAAPGAGAAPGRKVD